MNLKVNIKKLNELAKIPQYAKSGDAGLDLVATSYEYKDGRHVYGTGLAAEIPEGHVGLIFPRSSICKYDLRLTNSVGVIDSGYRGEIKAIFENDFMVIRGDISWSAEEFASKKIYEIGDRIAQMIIMPYPKVEFSEVDELTDTSRGTGGFGHSGV